MNKIGYSAIPLAVCPPSVPDTGSVGTSNLLGVLFSAVLDLFKIEFTLFGVSLSLCQIFLFSIAASITIWIIRELFLSD